MFFLHQFEQAETFGNVECFAERRLPGDFVRMLRRTLAAEQVQAQRVPARRGPRVNR